jgi:ABC-type transporter Mla subunit MlaD
MAVQDLTPQLRTRLSRLEKWVGLFVTLAVLLTLTGLAYYVHNTARRKGWFVTKVRYQTSLVDAAGLKIGQPVMLMGFEVGEITDIEANRPYDYYNVTVSFTIRDPYYGYLWTDSRVRVTGVPFLGGHTLEISKGRRGAPTVNEQEKPSRSKMPTGILIHARVEQMAKELAKAGRSEDEIQDALLQAVSTNKAAFYTNFSPAASYWLAPEEGPVLTERLQKLMNLAEDALTNKLITILSNAVTTTERINDLLAKAEPVVTNARSVMTNAALITAHLRDPNGSLGQWLLPPSMPAQISLLLTNVNRTVTNADDAILNVNSNLASVVEGLNKSLENLAGITSNLHAQVDANTNMLTAITTAITNADDLVQGLKRHWLLRSAFKPKPNRGATNAPGVTPAQSPKGASLR